MTYEYICTACGHQWEAEHAISAPPLRDCPKCGKASAKRQVSGGTGFLLKGGGWYADGYGSKSPAGTEKASSSSGESGASTAKDTGKTEASGSATASTTETPAKSPAKQSSGASG